MNTLLDQVVEELKVLPEALQWRVLEFVRTLAAPHGVPGKQLLQFAGAISSDDLLIMSQAIEQDCERVDANEW